MTKRDELRVDKALQGLEFPASHEQLLDFATDRAADAETLAALRALPTGQYATKDHVRPHCPKSPKAATPPAARTATDHRDWPSR